MLAERFVGTRIYHCQIRRYQLLRAEAMRIQWEAAEPPKEAEQEHNEDLEMLDSEEDDDGSSIGPGSNNSKTGFFSGGDCSFPL